MELPEWMRGMAANVASGIKLMPSEAERLRAEKAGLETARVDLNDRKTGIEEEIRKCEVWLLKLDARRRTEDGLLVQATEREIQLTGLQLNQKSDQLRQALEQIADLNFMIGELEKLLTGRPISTEAWADIGLRQGARIAGLISPQTAVEPDREAKRREAEAEAGAEVKLAESAPQIVEINAQMGQTQQPVAGGFREMMALARDKIRRSQELEALRQRQEEKERVRQAEIIRLRQLDCERRHREFVIAWAEYREVAEHAAVPAELKQQLWTKLCADLGLPLDSTIPGQLEWHKDHIRVAEVKVIRPQKSVATEVTKEHLFVNSLGMKFVTVPVSADGKQTVMFSIWQTRVRDYAAYAEEQSGVNGEWEKPGFEQGPEHPVVNVSWEDAKRFCVWLTAKERAERKIGAQQQFGLPMDEWWSWGVGIGEEEERAARQGSPQEKDEKIVWLTGKEWAEGKSGAQEEPELLTDVVSSWGGGIEAEEERVGKRHSPQEKDEKIKAGQHPWAYPWGKDWPPPKEAGNYGSSLKVDEYKYTSPVGSFAANLHGLFDMGGNVWEWCEDYYDGKSGARVLRGGSWCNDGPRNLLSCARYYYVAGLRAHPCGFRLVLFEGATHRGL